MSLPTNPLAKMVGSISESVASASNSISAGLSNAADSIGKADIDAAVNRMSGAIGSGLNGFAAGADSFGGTLGTMASAASTTVGDAIGSLQESAGSIANMSADVAATFNKLGAGGSLATGIASIAGQISNVAGQINNLLSLKRGASLPGGAEMFKQVGKAIELQPANGNDWRVRLNAEWSIFQSSMFGLLQKTGGVVFPYLPQITISTKANYSQIDPVHSNYPFMSYKNSSVDEISISGDFTAETESDAAYWIAATTFFKTATKMFFGTGENAGNPPIICILNGYGSSIFNNVPVVVKSFSIDLPQDVNYIRCDTFGTNTWVPVMSTVTITVQPIYNRERLRTFSLEDYARGAIAEGPGFI